MPKIFILSMSVSLILIYNAALANVSNSKKFYPILSYYLSNDGLNFNSPDDINPIPEFSSFGSINNGEVPLTTISYASGYEGDIKAEIINEDFGGFIVPSQNFEFINGITSMNVVDIKRTNAFSFSCPNDYKIEGTIINDFLTGNETASVKINGEQINCSSTYTPSLPQTITDSESISTLLIDGPNDDNFISTNCPEQNDNGLDIYFSCNFYDLYNVEVTDETGKTHLISSQTSQVISN